MLYAILLIVKVLLSLTAINVSMGLDSIPDFLAHVLPRSALL